MISKPLVFVSSTSGLAEERLRLRQELPSVYELYLFEEDRARSASPESHCRQQIERCDVFVGVLGGDYGSAFPGRSCSIVEWEHELAGQRGDVETLEFVKELGPGEARDPRQQAFIDRLAQFRTGMWVKSYRTPTELVASAHASLERWLVEFYAAFRDRRAAVRRMLIIPLTGLPTACVLFLGALAGSSRALQLTTSSMIGLCLTVAALVMLCGVVLLWLTGGSHE